jgi:hypothetical protein
MPLSGVRSRGTRNCVSSRRAYEEVFGEDLHEDAVTRALNVMEQARPDDVESPFDGEVFCVALKLELWRLLQPH